MKRKEYYRDKDMEPQSFTITKEAVDGLAKWLLKVIFVYTPIAIAALGVLLFLLYCLVE